MDARFAQRIEGAVSLVAAVILAAAVAFAVGRFTDSLVTIGGAAAASLSIALLAQRSITAEERELSLAPFAAGEIEFEEVEELILTDADQLIEERKAADELVLDDVLGKLGEDSRVVRLFDPAAMPTPGQLKARIDRHLGQTQAAAPDASAALHDALAELRLSLK